MSRPEIALHKKSNVMKSKDYQYAKRTQKDYSLSFKVAVVKEVESGFISKRGAIIIPIRKNSSPEQSLSLAKKGKKQ